MKKKEDKEEKLSSSSAQHRFKAVQKGTEERMERFGLSVKKDKKEKEERPVVAWTQKEWEKYLKDQDKPKKSPKHEGLRESRRKKHRRKSK